MVMNKELIGEKQIAVLMAGALHPIHNLKTKARACTLWSKLPHLFQDNVVVCQVLEADKSLNAPEMGCYCVPSCMGI